MLIFKWDKSYMTNISSVDKQHKNLVDMINLLGENIQSNKKLSQEELDKYFEKIANYAKIHFEDEEKCMNANNVDERHAEMHRKAHSLFLQEATKLYNGIKNHLIGPELLFHFLSNWLSIHILGTDKILAKQIDIIKQGKTPEFAYDSIQESVDNTIGPLLFTINQLFTRTMNMNHKLLHLNQSLEHQVSLRTKELQQVNNNLKAMALTDPLTKLGNRRAACAYLQNEWKKPFENNQTTTCIMIDVDKFKNINDTEGHEAGDKVLIIVANTIRDSVRNDDFVCRLGGDEFVVLSNNTNLIYLTKLAEHIRKKVEKIKLIFSKNTWNGSISIGIAQREPNMKAYIDLLKKSDEGLYLAKRNGRNQIGCVQEISNEILQ